ncbi:MAG TPA: NADPH:quinone reductase, partial [bacterium]|nr:NADPH:quinone reductase [bacterium]
QFGDPSVMKLEEVPELVPGPGQVLVRVHAAGVNPVETYVRAGAYARKPALPFTPGGDAAGVVEALGPGAGRFKVGDRVYAFGGHSGAYAQQLVAAESQLAPLPEAASFAQGAALGVPYATAHYALFARGRSVAGERLLVHGASGAVGLATLQLAKAAGLEAYGTAGSEAGLAAALEAGAKKAFDHRRPGYGDEIAALAGAAGLNLIVEMLANVNLDKDLAWLGLKGRVIVVGSRGRVEIDPRGAMGKDADIRGLVLANASPAELRLIHQDLGEGLGRGTLRPIIAQEFPLAEAPAAHAAVMQNGKVGKIVLKTD